MSIWLPLFLSLIAAFADIIGGLLFVFKPLSRKQMIISTALGSGFLLGATLLDRLPGAMESLPKTAPLYIMAGYLLMLLLDRFSVDSHHRFTDPAHKHADVDGEAAQQNELLMSRSKSRVAFIGLLVHTFMDGIIVAGAFTISTGTGYLMFFAITLHKLPEGFTMATITMAAGSSRLRAFASSAFLAVSTLLGAGTALWLGQQNNYFIQIIMAAATGTFIYISATDLIPMVKESNEPKAVYSVIISVFIFYISLMLVQYSGLK